MPNEMPNETPKKNHRRLIFALRVLLVMIIGLMALGAGVRTMNAGLSCPDWPLCFGKVIPDFHPAVWFEFVHRAYAGLVALLFFGICIAVIREKTLPRSARWAAFAGFLFLFFQIAAGALTVLWLVKWFAVTSHLMLATLFFLSVLWMLLTIDPRVDRAQAPPPRVLRWFAGFLAIATFVQIFLGGVVASTYAGSVCVDWPLCNGQWVPTWRGAIGHQILHRFTAYGLAVVVAVFAIVMEYLQQSKSSPWITSQLLNQSRWLVVAVCLQVVVGVLNLVFYIPPTLTVLHQSGAVILLALCLRLYLLTRALIPIDSSRAAVTHAGLKIAQLDTSR